MPEPLVSAIIPTKNRAALCARAIESVLGQTYPRIECIVVDDGSSDGTAELLAARFDERIRPVRNEVSEGPAGARNRGIAMARGTYIAFLDSDDEWLPAKIARQVEVAERGADVVYCRALNVTADGRAHSVQPARHRGNIARRLLTRNFVGSPSKVLIRRSCLEGLGHFLPGVHSEDWELWIRLAVRFRFDFVPEVLVRMEFDQNSRQWATTLQRVQESHAAIYESLSADPIAGPFVRARRRRFDATADYQTGARLGMIGRRREAARYFLRSARRNPLQSRVWKSLAALAAGPRLTAAAKRIRAWLVSRSVNTRR